MLSSLVSGKGPPMIQNRNHQIAAHFKSTSIKFFVMTVLIIFASVTSVAQGNDPLGCNAALVPSVSIDVSNKSLRLSFLRIIDKDNYELVKRSLSNSTNIIVDAIPIGNTLNYDDFNNRRSHEFQKENFQITTDEAETRIRQFIPEYASNNWLKCKQQSTSGFHGWAQYYDDNQVIIRFHYAAIPGIPSISVTNSTLTGATPTTSGAPPEKALPVGFKFDGGASEDRIFNRQSSAVFIATVNAGGFPVSVVIPPPSTTARITITPDTIHSGETAQLSWRTKNAGTIEISPGVTTGNKPNGSVQVNPTADSGKRTITYILNADGTTDTAKLTVIPDIPFEENTSATQEQGMIACPPGYAIAGMHVDANRLTCRRVVVPGDEQFIQTIQDFSGATQTDSPAGRMHVCPTGTYMRGFHNGNNSFLCSFDSRTGRNVSQHGFDGEPPSQGNGMHVCPSASSAIRVVAGVHVGRNTFQCGGLPRR